ncbi:hypothetical protein [Actinomadura flavalba]|uniref:hypothetical protein n=1 Tax=Actinomadura flavalba TaxID=1120938 RepID=UPI00037B7D53|nr:hypothetical protein [Actinomadura flavalba]
MKLRVTAVAALAVLTAAGCSEDAAQPRPSGSPTAAPAAAHPLAGTWRGPTNQDGSKPTIRVQPDGRLTLDSGGHSCTGAVKGAGRAFSLQVTDCVVPVPPIEATLAANGRTMMAGGQGGKKERWSRAG